MQKPVYALLCRNEHASVFQIDAKVGRSVRHRTAEQHQTTKQNASPRPGERTYFQLIVKNIDCAAQVIPRPHHAQPFDIIRWLQCPACMIHSANEKAIIAVISMLT